MHVLVIPSGYPTEGHSLDGVFFREQSLALLKRGLEVGVIYPDHRSLAGGSPMDLVRHLFRVRVGDDAGIATYRSTFPAAPKLPRLRARMWLWQLNRLMTRYIEERGLPDVIHAHGLLWAGVGAARIGASCGVPVMITAHSSSFALGQIRGWEARQIGEALRSVDSVVAVSRALRTDISRHAPEVPVDVVPNLVDTDFFSPGHGPERDGFTWLAVALLTENKGIATLLQAFQEAFADHPDVVLRVVGDGPGLRKLQLDAARSGIADRVTFTGRLSRTRVRDEMRSADGLVVSSGVETFGVVLIEALATGLPVVATRSGGPEDIVDPSVGLLVEPDDASALGRAVFEVYRDRLAWGQRAALIRSYAVDRYSERAVTDLIIDTYQRIARVGT